MPTTRALSTANINTTVDALPTFAEAAALTNRNLIYNGAMQIAQRGTSVASITAQSFNTADRWLTGIGTCGTWTQSVENDAPTGSGFRKSLKMLVTTAKSSLSANDRVWMIQQLEGQDIQRVAKGTSSAQQLTLSFWAKSNVTGTYTVMLFDNDNSRSVSAAYTVNGSGVWERETITFPADTVGVFDNDNNASLGVYFTLATGTAMTSGTLNTSWGPDVEANRCVGQVNLAAATSNYWQITGVQLEVGPTATAFEFKPFGQELQECQRYFQKNFLTAVAPANAIIAYRYAGFSWSSVAVHSQRITFSTTMRGVPVLTFYSPSNGIVTPANGKWQIYDGASTWQNATTSSVTEAEDGFVVDMTALTVTTRSAYIAYGGWTASAEL